MQEHLFDHVNLAARNIHFLNGAPKTCARECERYERAIARAGGIDLQILGLGANGHIGFNEPGAALLARTHCTRLTRRDAARERRALRRRRARVPREALSMGMVDDPSCADGSCCSRPARQGALRRAGW